jgi:redox-sensitive bicupin YhaK (pirin superfamily)
MAGSVLLLLCLPAACGGSASDNATDGGHPPDSGNMTGVAVNLGTAADYAVLAKSGISTVPTSAVTGNLGVSPAAATFVTGFSLTADATNVFATSTQVTGRIYAADYTLPTPTNLTTAVSDMQLAFTDAAGRAPNVTELGAGNIGGMTLTAGVYKGTGLPILRDVTLSGSATTCGCSRSPRISQEQRREGPASAAPCRERSGRSPARRSRHDRALRGRRADADIGHPADRASINGRLLASGGLAPCRSFTGPVAEEPMISLQRAKDRRHDRRRQREIWLTFSSLDRNDPLADGFGALETLDEERLEPGAGSVHRARRDAEIVTYVREGALAHDDSTGGAGVIFAGEFQLMTAGRGIRHSDTNASRTDGAQVFQLRLRPSEPGLEPSHEQKRFSTAERRGGLCVVASPDARRGSLRIHQDALMCSALLDSGQHVVHELAPGRSVWLHLVQGEVNLGDVVLSTGDGIGITAERSVSVTAREESEILLVDLGATFP